MIIFSKKLNFLSIKVKVKIHLEDAKGFFRFQDI